MQSHTHTDRAQKVQAYSSAHDVSLTLALHVLPVLCCLCCVVLLLMCIMQAFMVCGEKADKGEIEMADCLREVSVGVGGEVQVQLCCCVRSSVRATSQGVWCCSACIA